MVAGWRGYWPWPDRLRDMANHSGNRRTGGKIAGSEIIGSINERNEVLLGNFRKPEISVAHDIQEDYAVLDMAEGQLGEELQAHGISAERVHGPCPCTQSVQSSVRPETGNCSSG